MPKRALLIDCASDTILSNFAREELFGGGVRTKPSSCCWHCAQREISDAVAELIKEGENEKRTKNKEKRKKNKEQRTKNKEQRKIFQVPPLSIAIIISSEESIYRFRAQEHEVPKNKAMKIYRVK